MTTGTLRSGIHLTEHRRRTATSILNYVGWYGALVLTVLDLIVINAAPNSEAARSFGLFIVLLIGVGIAASSARSRMRLADTITAVLEAGMTAADESRRTCVMECDMEGTVLWVENPDVIGWTHDALMGHRLPDILPERFRAVHTENVARLATGRDREIGPTLTFSVRRQNGTEVVVQKQLSRLGNRLMATISVVPGGAASHPPLGNGETSNHVRLHKTA